MQYYKPSDECACGYDCSEDASTWPPEAFERPCAKCGKRFGMHTCAANHPYPGFCPGFLLEGKVKIDPDWSQLPIKLTQEETTALAKGEQIRVKNPWTEEELVLRGRLTDPDSPDFFLETVDNQTDMIETYRDALNLALEAAEAGIGKGLTPLEALRKIQNHVRDTLSETNGLHEDEWTGFQ